LRLFLWRLFLASFHVAVWALFPVASHWHAAAVGIFLEWEFNPTASESGSAACDSSDRVIVLDAVVGGRVIKPSTITAWHQGFG
jgi:hypothetical protein